MAQDAHAREALQNVKQHSLLASKPLEKGFKVNCANCSKTGLTIEKCWEKGEEMKGKLSSDTKIFVLKKEDGLKQTKKTTHMPQSMRTFHPVAQSFVSFFMTATVPDRSDFSEFRKITPKKVWGIWQY